MGLLTVDQIDFGPTDARHIIFARPEDSGLFRKVFLKPSNVDTAKYLDGRKSIIYGIKGAGKSAWLKHLEMSLASDAISRFVYFRKETDRFFDENHIIPTNSIEVANTETITKTQTRVFWRALIALILADILRGSSDKWAQSFCTYVAEAIRGEVSWLKQMVSRVPLLKEFVARAGSDGAQLELKGEFAAKKLHEATDIELFSIVGKIANFQPVYIFFDEMEISFTSSTRHQAELLFISSLVEAIRDLNEIFRKQNVKIFLIAAIRKEIANNISGGDISKIINDLGQEIIWSRRSWSTYEKDFVHPLFEIVLRRIAFSDDRVRGDFNSHLAQAIVRERFPVHIRSGNVQKDILDLTMYRPRDCALLFNVAQQIDAGQQKFRPETFRSDYALQYSSRLWVDIKEALQSKYSVAAIAGIRQILSGLSDRFTVKDFFDEVDNQSYDPAVCELADLTPGGMVEVLKDLFELGALGNITDDAKVRFRFRGQTSLLVGRDHTIVIHRALQPEFR